MSKIEIPKVENLKEGQVIKNYKELCNLIEIKPRTGEAKQIQLQKLGNIIKYHKEGHKFVIDEINDVNELDLIDKRTLGNKTVTVIEIGDIIIHKLLTEYKGERLTITGNELLCRLMLVSPEYKKLIYESEVFKFEVGINGNYLRNYRFKLGKQLNNRIESALKRLKNSGYIYYTKKMNLRFEDKNNVSQIMVLDNDRDIETLIDIKLKALDIVNTLREQEGKAKIEDMSYIILYNDFKRFKNVVCELLSKEYDKKCVGFWEGYVINTTKRALEKVLDDKKYNQNIEYVKKNFYELLEHTTKDIKDKELDRLKVLYEEVYEQENNEVSWGKPFRMKSFCIKGEIDKINNLSKILIG